MGGRISTLSAAAIGATVYRFCLCIHFCCPRGSDGLYCFCQESLFAW